MRNSGANLPGAHAAVVYEVCVIHHVLEYWDALASHCPLWPFVAAPEARPTPLRFDEGGVNASPLVANRAAEGV